jgi:hypothetical protein
MWSSSRRPASVDGPRFPRFRGRRKPRAESCVTIGTLSDSDRLSALGSPLSPPESIGTTANHPFWSVDRQEFVRAGSLEIGERLKTLSGNVKVVQQKLPRPSPEPVFNLEVHAEHVYFVGEDGVLVHNSGPRYRQGSPTASEINLTDSKVSRVDLIEHFRAAKNHPKIEEVLAVGKNGNISTIYKKG